jgi:hypothetical protein
MGGTILSGYYDDARYNNVWFVNVKYKIRIFYHIHPESERQAEKKQKKTIVKLIEHV